MGFCHSHDAQQEQDGRDGVEQGAVGEVEADVGIAPQEEHAQAGADAIPRFGPTGGGDLLRAGQEAAGVGQPVVGQRRYREGGDGDEDGQLAQPGAAMASVGDKQRQRRRCQRDGKRAGGQVGVGSQAAEQPAQEQPGQAAWDLGFGIWYLGCRLSKSPPQRRHRQRLGERLGHGAEPIAAQEEMPEGGGEEGPGEERHPARVALSVQQLAHRPHGRRDGRQPGQRRAQPQRQRRRAQQSYPQPGPIEEQDLFAGVGWDKDGGLGAPGDLAGQHAVGGLVVVQAQRQFGQAVQAQPCRDEQDERQCHGIAGSPDS